MESSTSVRHCDIVMKGGITSGVVYPAAVAEIAKDYVFKNVGGTSAGAIAAALTAAAERRRQFDGSMAGFDRVGAIPDWLAQDSRLFKLFVPNAGTKSLFNTVVKLFGRGSLPVKLIGLMLAYPVATLIGAIGGIVSLIAVWRTQAYTDTWLWVVALIIALLTILAGIAVAVGIALVRDLLGRLPKNFFGMVTGINDADRSSEVALCTWLAREMERTAGLPDDGHTPLTFGMLWDAKRAIDLPGDAEKPPNPDVNLEMITTNATFGRPYNFPIATGIFFFDQAELKRFFPDYIVDWMAAHSRQPRDAKEAALFASYAPKLALPLMGDLPVILATRMSLAFPVLLSAVPLWATDFSLLKKKLPDDEAKEPELEHCWFSDGGISSNFPLMLFDSPLPRWPTFAINLSGFPPGQKRSPNEADNVYMVKTNREGVLPSFTRIPNLTGFLSAVANAMQNWNDNTQSVLPGYRDRIVTVFLADDEGGLNLDMPPAILHRLKLRGAAAGALIAGRFKTPSELQPVPLTMGWENHRWLRFRSTMSSLKTYLTAFSFAMKHPEPPDVPYDALIGATTGAPANSYQITPPTAAPDVLALANDTAKLGDAYDAVPALDDRMPHPPPKLESRAGLQS